MITNQPVGGQAKKQDRPEITRTAPQATGFRLPAPKGPSFVPVADVGVDAAAAGAAVGAEGDDVYLLVDPGVQIDVGVAPGVAGDLLEVAALLPVLGLGVAFGFPDQGREPLLGRGVETVVEPVEVEGALDGADVVLGPDLPGLVGPVHDPGDDEGGEDGEDHHHHHHLDQGETAFVGNLCFPHLVFLFLLDGLAKSPLLPSFRRKPESRRC